MDATDLGLLILRLVVGLTFAAHGAQKAFGWWDGPGWAGWQAVMDRLGFRPTAPFAAVSIAAELIGGLMLATGFLTPLAATVVVGQSVVIIVKAHWARGFWNRGNGFEFPLALLAGTIAIGLVGPGALSVDGADGLAASDPIRIGLVALGVVGGLLAVGVAAVGRGPNEVAPQS
jgi:putative oxidoreductase